MALTNAEYIDFSFNMLSGELPGDIGSDYTSLRYLYLGHNKFHGPIPESYAMTGSLVALHLSDNMLTGGVPSTWSDAKDKNAPPPVINTIDVQGNDLTDGIDNNLCKMGVSNKGGSLVQLEADCEICFCNALCDCWGGKK